MFSIIFDNTVYVIYIFSFYIFRSLLILNEPFKSEKNAKVTNDIVSFSIPFIHSTTWYANVQSLKISDDQIIEVLNKKIGSMYRNQKCDDSKGLERLVFIKLLI